MVIITQTTGGKTNIGTFFVEFFIFFCLLGDCSLHLTRVKYCLYQKLVSAICVITSSNQWNGPVLKKRTRGQPTSLSTISSIYWSLTNQWGQWAMDSTAVADWSGQKWPWPQVIPCAWWKSQSTYNSSVTWMLCSYRIDFPVAKFYTVVSPMENI